MRYFELLESLSSVAIEKLLINYGNAIQRRLNQDNDLQPNRRYDLNPRELIELCISADPTQNSMYTKRLLQWWIAGEFRYYEDIGKAYDVLEIYNNAKPRLPVEKRDIGRIPSFSALYDLTRTFENSDLRSNAQKDRDEGEEYIRSGQAEIYLNTPEIKIIIPKTKEAAQYFGRNTRWCTSAKSNNQFHIYSDDGPLYILLFKKENKRWQFHFESAQFMDEQDDDLTLQEVKSVYALFPREKWEDAVRSKGYPIKYIDDPSYNLQEIAVSVNGYAIEYIKNPSEEIQQLAVSTDGGAIRKIPRPSEETKKKAVVENPYALTYIKDVSYEVQKIAIENNGYAIEYIKNPSEEIQKIAVSNEGKAIQYIKNPSEEVQHLAVSRDPYALQFIRNPTKATIFKAIQGNALAIVHLSSKELLTDDVIRAAIFKNPDVIRWIPVSEEMERFALHVKSERKLRKS